MTTKIFPCGIPFLFPIHHFPLTISCLPAGLIAALHVEFGEENASLAVLTDTQWQAAHTSCPQWQIGSDGGQDWPAVKVIGPFEMAPWNLSTVSEKIPELYPHYKTTAALLDGMGLPPDFSADQPIRYIHRCTDNEDSPYASF